MPRSFDSISHPGPKKKEVTPVSGATSPTPSVPEVADTYDSLFPEPHVSITKPPLWIVIALGVGVVFILLIMGLGQLDKSLSKWLALSPITPSPSAPSPRASEASSTPSATPSPTPTTIPSSTPTPSATATPTINKASISLRVRNGSGENGAASTAKTVLEKAGFKVASIGNANSQNYQSTVIYYKTGALEEAKLAQEALKNYKTSLEESTSLASPNTLLIVIGAQ